MGGIRSTWLVASAGALLAALAVAQASVDLPSSSRLSALWTSHPKRLAERVMRDVGTAAASGRPLDASTREAADRLAHRAPLEPEPYLIAAAQALEQGDGTRADALLSHAVALDPRSAAARYFRASRFLSTGQTGAGLREMRLLSQLVPEGTEAVVPALIAYARSPGGERALGPFLQRSPDLAPFVLGGLARDPANADLVEKLAGPAPPPGPWRDQLVSGLIDAGQIERAHRLWERLAGVKVGAGLYNPQFAVSSVPPPFNWTFASDDNGIAEPTGGGQLDVLFYGRSDAILARQIVLLAPGNYRLSYRIVRQSGASTLGWRLTCLLSKQVLLDAPLPSGIGVAAQDIAIPPNCGAQALELRGRVGGSETSSATVASLSLTPNVGAR